MDDHTRKLTTAKALAYAIETIEHLALHWQEMDTLENMKRLLEESEDVYKFLAIASAKCHIGASEDEDILKDLGFSQPQEEA
jgi:DNA repair ATPase RecN